MVEDSRIEIDPPDGPGAPYRDPPIITIRQGSGRYWALGCLLGIVAMIAIFVTGLGSITSRIFGAGGPDPETIATASLEGLREQNVLVPFTARFVAVTTSTQRRFGLSARKTLIMPGDVRYELDLGALDEDDVDWDAEAKELTVTLPDITVSNPAIDIDMIREYDDGGVLMALTDAETSLDEANRREGQRSLIRQAQAETPMRLAREAARTAVETNFELPLRAAGIDATVRARFANEDNPRRMERSRNVIAERQREAATE